MIERKTRRRSWFSKGVLASLLFGVSFLTACSGEQVTSPVLTPVDQPRVQALESETPVEPNQADDDLQSTTGEADIRNGEQIYFTAINDAGERMTFSDGPDFGGMMMGSYLTCAACHGPEAQGGRHIMHMQVMDAPAISYRALSEEGGEKHAAEGDDHNGESGAYDLEDFRLAVFEGQHPDGDALDQNMPRWYMAEEDLIDLFAFLKTLP